MSDQESLQAYRDGEETGFDQLYKKYRTYVYNCCLGIVRHPDDAEDVSQKVWLSLSSYLSRFEERCDFKTLAYRVAKTNSIDFLRKKKLRSVEILMAPEDIANLEVVDPMSPDHNLMLEDVLKRLPASERTLILDKIEGYTDKELADKHGKSVNNIKTDLFRIREKLRRSER